MFKGASGFSWLEGALEVQPGLKMGGFTVFEGSLGSSGEA
jgi:hypothetical protein